MNIMVPHEYSLVLEIHCIETQLVESHSWSPKRSLTRSKCNTSACIGAKLRHLLHSCLAASVIMESDCLQLKPPDEFSFPFKPYDIQIDFMKKLYETLEGGNIGIFESPTGTVSLGEHE